MQNGYIERFNRSFRESILDAYLFEDIMQVQILAEEWVWDYNHKRPNEALGGKTPNQYREEGCIDILSICEWTKYRWINKIVYLSSRLKKRFEKREGCIDINILSAYYKRTDKIIESGRITADNQFYDINSMVDYLCQISPVDDERIAVMNTLLIDYEERKRNKQTKR